ncbi:topoisomerase DNA-binding C4 zinc finger domain-containing protein [Pedobacter nyackensis]
MQNKCPRSGAELVLKTGKFGDFKGCCRFPSGMYTVN